MGRSGLILTGGGAVSRLISGGSDQVTRGNKADDGESQEWRKPQSRPRLPGHEHGNRITVLSIDGGGIRGLIPSAALIRLEELLQVRINETMHYLLSLIFDITAS